MELILGTAQLTHRYGILAHLEPAASDRMENGRELLREAWRLGIRTVDTAPVYGDAEAAIGSSGLALRVHTKVPAGATPGRALADSLARLDRDEVDVLYLHEPEAVLATDRSVVAAARDLVGAGTRAIGASVYTVAEFDAAVADPAITVIQAPMSILDRRIDESRLVEAERCGTTVLARSVLLQGLLADPLTPMAAMTGLERPLALFGLACSRLGRSPLEVAIRWVLDRPGVAGAVLGVSGPAQLEEVATAWAKGPLEPGLRTGFEELPLPPDAALDPRTWHAPT